MSESEVNRELSSIRTQDIKALKHSDTCVILHLYYPEMWEEIRSYLSSFGEPFDLFITIPHGVDISESTLRAGFPNAQIYRCENRGRDVAPFLALFAAIWDLGYKYICKIHTKKVTTLATEISGVKMCWKSSSALQKLLPKQKRPWKNISSGESSVRRDTSCRTIFSGCQTQKM